MKRPKLSTKEHADWMRRRAEERSKKLFREPTEFNEREIISGSDQSIHSTDAEVFPDELKEYSPQERKPKLVTPKEQ